MYSVNELKDNQNTLMELHTSMIFNNEIIPSIRDHSLVNPNIIQVTQSKFDKMVQITEKANEIILKVSNLYLQGHISAFRMNIPNKYFIEKNKNLLKNLFQVRADVFEKENGGLFIGELNYCKPSGQKELELEKYFIEIDNNPNKNFKDLLANGLLTMFNEYYKDTNSLPKVAFVCDPYKYEEIALGLYYKEILSIYNIEIDIIGVNNLTLFQNKIMAFDKEYNVVFRRFPVEFNNEFPIFGILNEMFVRGDLLLINEARAIIPQNKDIFSILWMLTNSDSDFLTSSEKQFVEEFIPFTINFKDFINKGTSESETMKKLRNEQKKWVIKEVFTRYSEGVYLGKELHPNEWFKVIKMALQKPESFILQECVAIKNDPVYYLYCDQEKLLPEQIMTYENIKDIVQYEDEDQHIIKNYINYGIHLINGKYAGIFARCSPTLVTRDDTVFLMPINITETSM